MIAFTLETPRLRVTDPCYEKDVWCVGVIEDALPGKWNAEIEISDEGSWGRRVASLIVRHEQFPEAKCTTQTGFDIGVDSGQAGFFDDSKYPEGSTGEFGETDTMYGQICEKTLADQIGGVGYGVASSTGYGDGSYDCLIAYDPDGKNVVAAKLIFITDEDEEEMTVDEAINILTAPRLAAVG